MANPNLSEKSQSTGAWKDSPPPIHGSAREAMRSVNPEHIQAEDLLNQASETAGQFYDQAQGWVSENRRVLYQVGGFLAVGLVGYLFGRTLPQREKSETKGQ